MCIDNHFQCYVFLAVLDFSAFYDFKHEHFPTYTWIIVSSWCVSRKLARVIVKRGKGKAVHCNRKSYRLFPHFPSPASPQCEAFWLSLPLPSNLNQAGHRLVSLNLVIKNPSHLYDTLLSYIISVIFLNILIVYYF